MDIVVKKKTSLVSGLVCYDPGRRRGAFSRGYTIGSVRDWEGNGLIHAKKKFQNRFVSERRVEGRRHLYQGQNSGEGVPDKHNIFI